MPKIYSVDRAINENKPYVELRGRYYEIRDLTVKERIQKILEFKEKQDQAEKEAEEEGKEPDFDAIQNVIADAVQEALVDVPDEVAESITENEWRVLQEAIREAQQDSFPVNVEKKDDIDPEKVGGVVG